VAVLAQLAAPFRPTDVGLPTWDDCASRHVELYEQVSLPKPTREDRGAAADARG
jgi:hypothetical protein